MTKNTNSIKNLQKALGMELSAVHQYMLHAHTLEDWGLDKLATKMREEMAEEQGHAENYMRRIFFLGGKPEVIPAAAPHHSDSLKDMFSADLADERDAIDFYTKAAQDALAEGDIGTRQIFEATVLDEEGHKEWLELQLSLIERLGEKNYTALQMGNSTANSASGA